MSSEIYFHVNLEKIFHIFQNHDASVDELQFKGSEVASVARTRQTNGSYQIYFVKTLPHPPTPKPGENGSVNTKIKAKIHKTNRS